ncbi:MAG: Ig domain-containing protein [Burkholderiales bacterium]
MQKLSLAAMLLLLVTAATQAQDKPGTPISSGIGLAETTAQIMARQATASVVRKPRVLKWRRTAAPGKSNPETLPEELAAPLGKSIRSSAKAAQNYSVDWLGADFDDSGSFPPYTMGAIGPSQYIVVINGRIRTFDRKGLPDPTLDADTDTFFAPAMTPLGGPIADNFTYFPRIRYDRLTQRWYVVMIDAPNDGTQTTFFSNRVMIAVSDTPNISSATTWRYFWFSPTADFVILPTLGIDNNALYIGAIIGALPDLDNMVNTDAYVVRKSSLQGAGPATVTLFHNLIADPACASGDGPTAPQGADNADAAATEGYFIGTSFCFASRLIARRVSNPGSPSPTISSNITINTPAFFDVFLQPHLGNTAPGTTGWLDPSGTELRSATVRNGNLYTAHNIAVKADGTGATSGDPNPRNGLRWYRINNLTTAPAIADSGTVYDSAAASGAARQYITPGIQVNGQGHVAIGFTASGGLQRINAGFTGRLATDAPGVTDTPTLYTNALQAYNPPLDPGGTGGRSWGEYSFTSIDPNDDMTMYTIQEYASAQDTWGVRVARLNAPGPATPTAISTATVPTGTASTTVTLTGTSTNGSGFFDPGSGFPNRIAVEILPGVTVTGVTVVDPTHLSVTFSTVGAFVGEKVIRVINPDGQTVSQASTLLTVTGTQAPFFISPNSVICTVGSACNFTFVTQNGAPASTFSIAGTLPAGVTFATPSLSGTPASGTQGTYTLTVTANNGTAPNATQTFTLIVTAPCGGFTDVTTGDIFCNSSDWLKNRGVTLGCTATQYCPTQFVTRAQMALFMQRLGDAISPAIYSDNVIGTGALNVDNRPYVCITPAFPAMNYPRVALVSWMFDGYADGALDVRVYSRTSFDNLGSFVTASLTTNEVAPPRLRVNERAWSTVSANVKVSIPAGSSPRFALRMDRTNGALSGNFTDGRCNISVIMTSVNGGALPYDVPTQPQEPTDP